jgi:hypothetical protein
MVSITNAIAYPSIGLIKYCARNPTPTCKVAITSVNQQKDSTSIQEVLSTETNEYFFVIHAVKGQKHTVQGFLKHLLKSSNVNVSPIDSIKNPRPTVKRSVSNQVTCRPTESRTPYIQFGMALAERRVQIVRELACERKFTIDGL